MAGAKPLRNPDISVEEFLLQFPPPVRRSATELRKLIRECLPGVTERVYPGWKLIGYRVPDGRKSRYCCYLYPSHAYTELGFEHGRLLSDPQNVLEGKGTQVRTVRFRTSADIKKNIVRQLLIEAAMKTTERNR